MSSDRKLKICHVITRMIVGGAQENTLFTVMDHLARGHEVVLVTGPSPGREGELLDFAGQKAEVVVMPELVRELDPVNDFKALGRLREFFRERGFDVVHTHSSKAGVLGRAAAWAERVPVVVHTVHGQAFHPYEKPWKNAIYKRAERYAAARCHRIFAVAQAMIDQCVEAGIAPREKYQVVYSGMEIDKFLNSQPEAALRQELGIPEGVPVVATLARLFPLKGYEFVVPAALEVAKTNAEVHFLLIGDGPMHDELAAQIAAAGLSSRFHFAGLVAPDQVYRYLALSTLLWHLSLREGLPRSVVQSLASGKPAIGFRLDGTPEVVFDGETGYCVEPGDVAAVVRHTLALLDDPELATRMGENGRKLVAERFDHHYMSDVLEKEYLRLLGEK